MPGIRCYRPPSDELPGTQIQLDRSENHHLLKVRRARPGDEVTVFDGEGNLWECLLQKTEGSSANLAVLRHHRAERPRCEVTLAQALPKGKILERIMQKATELGASRIQPLTTQRCEADISPGRHDSKISKWRKIAVEACKQSGNPFLPQINAPAKIEDYFSSLSADSLKIMASLDPQDRIKQIDIGGNPPNEAVILIGPEGDLTDNEYALARQYGFRPVSLGPNVLRVETAAVVALGILNHTLQAAGESP